MENSSGDGNTRLPDLPPEKSVCRSEATVRTGHGTTDWFQIEKGVHQSCHLAYLTYMWSSVQFSCSVVSDSLWPHGLQHARPPCPSPTPGVHSKSCPLSPWCHPTISSCHPLLLLPSIFQFFRSEYFKKISECQSTFTYKLKLPYSYKISRNLARYYLWNCYINR